MRKQRQGNYNFPISAEEEKDWHVFYTILFMFSLLYVMSIKAYACNNFRIAYAQCTISSGCEESRTKNVEE